MIEVMPWGKHVGTKIKDLPVDYLDWLSRKSFHLGIAEAAKGVLTNKGKKTIKRRSAMTPIKIRPRNLPDNTLKQIIKEEGPLKSRARAILKRRHLMNLAYARQKGEQVSSTEIQKGKYSESDIPF